MVRAMASRTASARRPASAGPSLMLCPAQDVVAFLVARHRPARQPPQAPGDHDVARDKSSPLRPTRAQGSSRRQADGQLASQGAAALDEQRLIAGLLADAHRLVIRAVNDQALGDLFRAPRPRASPILSRTVPPTLPRHRRPRDRAAATGPHDAGQLLFQIGAQRCVPGKLGRLGPARRSLDVPLSDGRAAIIRIAGHRGCYGLG